MSPAPDSTQPAPPRPRRKLNIPRIKAAIVLVSCAAVGFASGVTGLGAQAALAPMLTWMLGISAPKAYGTAMRCAVAAATAAVVAAIATGRAGGAIVAGVWLISAVWVFIGATVGALIARALVAGQPSRRAQQLFHTLAVGLTMWVLLNTTHSSVWNQPARAVWSWTLLLLLGAVVGAGAQVSTIMTSVLLLPALVFLAGFAAKQAVVITLLTIAVAGALPCISYTRQGLIDRSFGTPGVLGAVIGGLCGGALLVRLDDKPIVVAFCVLAMLLSGRELARLTYDRPKQAPQGPG